MKINLLIGGSTYTSSLLEREWDIQMALGSALDQATFVLDDPHNTIALNSGVDVLIGNGDDTTVYYFGGVLLEVSKMTAGLGRRHVCKAVDWSFVLSRAVVSGQYKGRSDDSVINSTTATPKGIFRDGVSHTDLSEFDSTSFVSQGVPDTKFLRFQDVPVSQVLEGLAELAGFVWHVDPYKRLHYGRWNAVASTSDLS